MKSNKNYLKESLLDFDTLSKSIKESTTDTVRSLLGEAVRDTYNKILTEDDEKDDDYEIEEVDDMDTETTPEDTNDESKEEETETSEEKEEDTDDDSKEDTAESDSDTEETEETDDEPIGDIEETEVDTELEPSSEDEWDDFDDYKISDDTYDLSDAEDNDVVKVYKLLKDTDEVLVDVDKESNTVKIQNKESGDDYLIDLGDFEDNEDTLEDEVEADNNDFDEMNEGTIFEVDLGYTDNYQNKDVMTKDNVNEPGKNVSDWDAGVPKGNSKPFARKSGDNAPYDKSVNEDEEMEDEIEEATNVGGFVQQNTTSKSHIPSSNGRKARNSSVAGVKTKGTPNPRYSAEVQEEARKMKMVHNRIMRENKQLKEALGKFKETLESAAITNVNLGQIVKLISENAVTTDEKKNIIARFGNEAKTIEQSKQLYESIKRELKSNPKRNINEERTFTANGSKQINETQIYQSKDLLESLDLMHRICK